MLPLFKPKTNGPKMAKLLLDILEVKISETTLTQELEEHPDYPSLLSISDVLKHYGVENMGIKVDPVKLVELSCPFITQLRGTKEPIDFFTVVKEVNESTVHYFDPEKYRWAYSAKEDFLNRWSGITLLIEVGDNAGEKEIEEKLQQEKRVKKIQYLSVFCIPLIILISGIIGFMRNGISIFLPFIFSILTLSGCVIGIVLLWYEIDQHNEVLQQICSNGKKVNCSAVLQSKASKIAGISWSAIGCSYFIGVLLLLLFSGFNNPAILFIISWVNTIAATYVVFSIYYQWRIVKQWCVLCLLVQGLLILQLAISLLGGWQTLLPVNTIKPELIISTITAFVTPFIVITLFWPAFKKAKESKRVNTELQKLKHNRQIFEALLQKQKELTEIPEGLGIILGNSNAPYKLIKVCNPYCGPCARAHQPMEDLLYNNNDIQLQIIFTATNNENDITTPPVKHLLAIDEKKEASKIKQALGDWYQATDKNYEKFAAKYPLNGELNYQHDKIEAMKDWCEQVNIEFTPTFFVSILNQDDEKLIKYYQLPEIYNVKDLKYFFSI